MRGRKSSPNTAQRVWDTHVPFFDVPEDWTPGRNFAHWASGCVVRPAPSAQAAWPGRGRGLQRGAVQYHLKRAWGSSSRRQPSREHRRRLPSCRRHWPHNRRRPMLCSWYTARRSKLTPRAKPTAPVSRTRRCPGQLTALAGVSDLLRYHDFQIGRCMKFS